LGVRQHRHSDMCVRSGCPTTFNVKVHSESESLMADSPDSPPRNANSRNPNWGGRREGSGRKKRTLTLARPPIPQVDSTTPAAITQTQHPPVNRSAPMSSEAPTRGFFAPRNHTQLAHSLHPMMNDTNGAGTDGQQGGLGVDQEANGTLYCMRWYPRGANYISI
jgi:hypothetical protein